MKVLSNNNYCYTAIINCHNVIVAGVAQCQWLDGRGSVDVAQWTWLSGLGSMAMAQWSWLSGPRVDVFEA